ncbi:MAG TPA: hypothetical protein ENJ32_02505, partial [Crenotrichaceae bacterium]|nr:hypothetical protein [Crenotrichaceae bacterium]
MGLGTADQGKHIHQIIELLAAGNGQLAVTSYHEIVDQISDQTQYWFESLFGLYALSSDDDVLFEQSLSTRFIEDSVIAKQALEFYCQNQNPHAVQQLLRKLSYDSPYSDFRRIISTLLDIVNAPRGLDRLDGIDALSPYRRIAGLIQLAAGYSTGMLVLAEFSPVEQQFIQALICQTKAALQPLCLPSFTPQQLFEFLLNNAEVFEEEILQKLLTNLVVDYPAGLDAYRQHDDQLSEFECFRLQALASERSGHWENAASLWSHCIQTLDQINIEDYEVARQLILQR